MSEQKPLFSEKRLAALSARAFTDLVVRTRLQARRQEGFAPEYADVLAQLKRHVWRRAKGGGERSVYIIGAGGHVKIGVARDPAKRLRAHQVSHPGKLELLLVLPGGREFEQKLHAQFARYRTQGEWFRHEGHLRNFIARRMAKTPGGDVP